MRNALGDGVRFMAIGERERGAGPASHVPVRLLVKKFWPK